MTDSSRVVFLSYASQDADAARRICEALQADGIKVWFDQAELRGGDAWDRQIRQQIQDCALFIPIISATTQERVHGYFRREWKLAVDHTHDLSERVAFLLPVVIDDTGDAEADVPEGFRAIQWTRLPAGETSPAFLARVRQLLSPGERQNAVVARSSTVRSDAPSPWSKLTRWVIVVLVLCGVGYFVLNRFVLPARTLSPATSLPFADLAASPINEKSIAVLPFADLSEKNDQGYFSDGLAAELLDLLAKTPGLHVIARTSSFSFKGKSDDIPTIAGKLHVANILEGSVRKAGNRLRVTTQLIRASSGEHLWSETYDRELKDVFAVQDEIAAAVVGQLKLKLASSSSATLYRTSNIEAYNQYLLGREFANRGSLDGLNQAVEAFHRAIALDPNYVAAYDGLALAELNRADPTGDAAGYQRAKVAAAKAVELGPNDANAYAARGLVRLSILWDWAGAQADLEKAIALDPNDARFRQRYAVLMATLGRVPEAIAAARKAAELDPLKVSSWQNLTQFLLFTRDFAAANEANRRELQISPDSPFVLIDLGMLQLIEGKVQEAFKTFHRIEVEPFRLCGVAMAAHTLKDSKTSQQALDELAAKYSADAAYQVAQVHAWRGETDKAFEWLDRALAQRDAGLSQLKIDPIMDSIRGDSRYRTFLRKMNLPE